MRKVDVLKENGLAAFRTAGRLPTPSWMLEQSEYRLQPKFCDAADQENVVVETRREDAVEKYLAGRQQRPH